jgi:disintegrin and metalloproteinase domain-containing protein 17
MFLAYGKQSPHFLDSILTHYELVHQSELRHSSIPHRHLSSSSSLSLGYSSESRQIHFYSLGRSFGLHLNIHRDLFSPEFDAVSVDERGESRKIHINRESFHIGHVLGDNKSSVFAHLSDGGLLSAHITTHNESYYIEPAGLYFNGSHDRHMIMYKSSDMVESGFSSHNFDYVMAPPVSEREMRKEGLGNNVQSHILKRQLNNDLNTCKLALVVDFRIYKLLLSSESTVISTLVNRMSGVDKSFRDTQWIIDSDSNTRTGFGLQIGKIIIHTEPNPDPNHYNSVQAAELGFEHLLRRFSRGDWSSYCLAHLITLRQFPSGQLGLAYIASSNADETGGICSTNVIDRNTGDVVVYNTGVSVAATQDRLLLLNEAQLVIAHEIGHSWGSPHDPGNNEDCRLQYIMNEFAQSGLEDSHKRFSPCSRLSIGRVLINKATCFQALSTSNCGNYIIDKEEGEECDGGRFTIDGQDPCCDSSCHLRSGMRCSDVNQACCINCTVAPKNSKICHFVGNISNDCTIETPCE